MKTPSRKTLSFLLLGTLAVLLLVWLVLREPQQMATLAKVQRGLIEVSFVEEGKTRLQQRYVVTAPVAGMVRRIVLQPGDPVKAGQAVADPYHGSEDHFEETWADVTAGAAGLARKLARG